MRGRGQAVNSIWIADVATQGESGILNEEKIGKDRACLMLLICVCSDSLSWFEASWNDHPRDLLHMINHFRSEMPRPLVGIGHSMGGNHLYIPTALTCDLY